MFAHLPWKLRGKEGERNRLQNREDEKVAQRPCGFFFCLDCVLPTLGFLMLPDTHFLFCAEHLAHLFVFFFIIWITWNLFSNEVIK